ncbi:MAG: hemerythrin domain-containing protein [Crocinitomicaceae bacterium]
MNISENNTITEIVTLDNRTMCIFETYGIDPSIKGNRALIEVREKRSISPEVLIESLHTLILSNKDLHDFSSWPADILAEYIEKKHHRYLEETISGIEALLNKLASTHRLDHPELEEIKNLFRYVVIDMREQMEMEETILFPDIKKWYKQFFWEKFRSQLHLEPL